MTRARRSDRIVTEPLFDLPAGGGGPVSETRPSPQRAVTTATCPCCTAGGRDVGLLRAAEHLVWREHHYTTWSGARMACRASGVAACVAPPKGQRPAVGTPKAPATCPHTTAGGV